MQTEPDEFQKIFAAALAEFPNNKRLAIVFTMVAATGRLLAGVFPEPDGPDQLSLDLFSHWHQLVRYLPYEAFHEHPFHGADKEKELVDYFHTTKALALRVRMEKLPTFPEALRPPYDKTIDEVIAFADEGLKDFTVLSGLGQVMCTTQGFVLHIEYLKDLFAVILGPRAPEFIVRYNAAMHSLNEYADLLRGRPN